MYLYVIQSEFYRHMKINVFGSVTVDPKHLPNIWVNTPSCQTSYELQIHKCAQK